MIDKYTATEIEPKWQARWAEDHLYEVHDDDPRPKWYALTMFPYTSGDLHIGHWYAMAPSDVFARFKRMQGYNVLHPMGFDSFGLPAENAAIKRGIHPYTWTMKNVENMRRQLKSIGAIYDWSREVVTCLPDYYKWTQWFFLKLWEAGLAYRSKAPVNWCPMCKAVLANEQVVDGACWRCDTQTTRRDLEQWFFRITKYADELMKHDGLDWPERIKTMQYNWVGRSEGAEISFGLDVPGVEEKEIKVFTTRPDTAYGVTFMVLAPENPLVAKITAPECRMAVDEYVHKARARTEIERLSTEKEKDGVFTGAYVTNHLNGEKVPVYIADYVLLSYGTGAVMAVPAHDERDFAFAKRYNLPVKQVIAPSPSSCHAGAPQSEASGAVGGTPVPPSPAINSPNSQLNTQHSELTQAYLGLGAMVNSGPFDGTPNEEGKKAITAYLEKHGWGKATVSYKLRDWLISRQRYWGAPIPMVYCEKCGIRPVPEKDLPVLLPEDVEFRPGGDSPLASHEGFLNATCPVCGGKARRETDTMDTFMCSSWYFLRYCSPRYAKSAFDPDKVRDWMPVDIYTGGAEHAVMHLFYSRFFVKALRDMGRVNFDEPFLRLFNQGTITHDHAKMSKSRGNVINPDDYVNTLGADTVRAYLMFVGPWEQGGDWDDSGISGLSRFLNRVWALTLEPYAPSCHSGVLPQKDEESGGQGGTPVSPPPSGRSASAGSRELIRLTHQVVRKVTDDLEKLRFNTMLAALMEYSNYLSRVKDAGAVDEQDWNEAVRTLLLLLAPTAPHATEELWSRLGLPYSIHNQPWPKWDAELARDEEVPLLVQVNGKLRDKLMVAPGLSEEEARNTALSSPKVQAHVAGKTIAQCIYVPGRLINLVVK